MLRIAVISLIVANLLLLGFQGSKSADQPETTVKTDVVEDSSVPTIHLYSEMVNDQDLMSDSRRCFSLGPFHSFEDVAETRALLEEVSANISERETQALVEKGYWVFMPPYESLLEANKALFSLEALGLKDIAVIYNGDWKNAISLGYFLRQENAARRKKDLEDRDFAPKMRVQRQSESRYWLDYEQNPGSGLIAMDMQDRPNDFMQRSLPCPDQNPFEITASVAENLAAEVKQPQKQIPEEESQLPPEEISKPQVEEISEPQEAEGDSSQPEDSNGSQSTEELDLDTDESIDTTPVDNAEAAVPEPAIETEQEASKPLVDDILQKQLETLDEGDGSQPIGDDGVGTEETIDSTTVDADKVVPTQIIVTEPENADESPPVEDDAINAAESMDSTLVDSEKVEPGLANETEPENSVGTGPVIGFGTEPEDSNETESEDGEETRVEDGGDTETEPDGG